MSFGINFSDILSIEGMYPNMPEYPFTPGCECAGIVSKIGKNVTKVKIGDKVLCTNNITFGSHSTVINTSENYVYVIPEAIDFNDISGLSLIFMINYHIFKNINLVKGEKILIQGSSGGVGHIAVQMAKNAGAEVFTTYNGSEKKYKFLYELNSNHILNYNEGDYAEEIKKITKNYGVDVVINMLEGADIQKGLNLLAPNGRYVEIAMVGLRNAKLFDLSNLVNNQTFYSFDIGRIMKNNPELRDDYIQKMFEMVSKGKIKQYIDKVFDINDIHQAYRYMKERKHVGKVLVTNSIVERKNYPEEKRINCASNDIAVIGMSGKFGESENIEEFWEHLINNESVIKEVPAERWNNKVYYDEKLVRPYTTNCKWGGFVNDYDCFDPLFFNISGYEAKFMDPQQRILLEECWKALENSGYAIEDIENTKIGTFIGCSPGDYQDIFIKKSIPFDAQSFWGTSPAINAARLAYYLNLQGPTYTIDTACSSSAVAIFSACQNLWLDECEMAVVGGSFINTTPKFYIMSSKAGMLSTSGKCKTFDDSADGFVPGEGVGAVVLKKLENAIKDHDYIYGVIKGIGCNQDGRTNGITAPSIVAQESLQKQVYKKFNINPESISYVEAHGTGTRLGDPIEVEALIKSFNLFTNRKNYCAIGSVKSNIGHTSAVSGIASMMKILKSFEEGVIPATINYNNLNKMIQLENSPFYIAEKNINWITGENKNLRAAINSFGFSGTNVHMVLENYIKFGHSRNSDKTYFIPLSIKNKELLKVYITILLNWLKKHGGKYELSDIAGTLQMKRRHYQNRRIYVVNSLEELIVQLGQTINDENYNKLLPNLEQYELCSKYLSGENIQWINVSKDYYTIPLPSTPLCKEKYWIDYPESTMQSVSTIFNQLNEGELSAEEAEKLLEGIEKGE
ncbi:beta-ketoacyl synthase N-terminal-like domain-containing protein [Blautia producta]|uniref:Ketosynthase family 3 (KS3) domain-containing protein n=4 Tax=Blautia producta TaxID=33035 RepID=A0A7G5MVR4_9FIRM|nr:beta-ketoacyl synthase N-terminal-like domain-containing protein [Blautia producta]QIB54189.1 zinc-binding dehydrogenase [Blautia producta ATCC 27340 = DSM 2950]QMW78707.1 hypothetical protein E5259_14515 [Blautia producta]